MNFLLGLQVGFREILAHKFRSFLTMLGVILGVASLLAMFGLTEGIARGMREQLEARGGIEKVQIETKDVSAELAEFSFLSRGRSLEDAEAIRVGAPLIDLVVPESNKNGFNLRRGSEVKRVRAVGTTPGYTDLNQMTVENGRNLCDLDLERGHRVVTLGRGMARELWPEDPEGDHTGEAVFLNDVPFRVVGIYEFMLTETAKREAVEAKSEAQAERRQRRGRGNTGRGRWRDPYFLQNSAVLIPLTTMVAEFKSAAVSNGVDAGPDLTLDSLDFRIRDTAYFEQALAQVENVLTRTHRGIDDFSFDTREDWADGIETSVRSTRISGGLIAGISLLVGGIGITNIMLASITERIREIGVRRAVGATGRDIFTQILVESIVIGVIGGLIGLATAGVLTHLLASLSPESNAPIVTMNAIGVSFSFAVIIGVFAGIYPAWKAARLDPIEALRYG